jgi:hypothetical protein
MLWAKAPCWYQFELRGGPDTQGRLGLSPVYLCLCDFGRLVIGRCMYCGLPAKSLQGTCVSRDQPWHVCIVAFIMVVSYAVSYLNRMLSLSCPAVSSYRRDRTHGAQVFLARISECGQGEKNTVSLGSLK